MMADSSNTKTAAIAERLKSARSKVFSSAADAARALDMKPVTVRAHESGQNGVSPYDLERYARRYGVNPGWLLTGKGNEAPSPSEFQEFGDALLILHAVQDNVWINDPAENWNYAYVENKTSAGEQEWVMYSDPRFPVEMVAAFKVISQVPNNDYPGDSVVFGVPRWEIGYSEGDHVIIYLEKGDFTQATIRRVVRNEKGEMEWHAITSHEPPLTHADGQGDVSIDVHYVVIGAQIRRKVNLPDPDTLRNYSPGAELVMADRNSKSTDPIPEGF